MQSIGEYTISDYTQLIKLVLSESAKYFLFLLLAVLAVRLWRRLPKISGANKQKNLVIACLVSAVAACIGYVSISHSLGRLYSSYGMKAFKSGNLVSAFSLFQTSSEYWNSADTLGKKGICVLLSGKSDQGLQLLEEATTLRKGKGTPFEQFYEGVFFFFHEQPDKAFSLLQGSSVDLGYRWDAIKLLAIIQMEKNNASEAVRLMSPFLGIQVKEVDHAYVMASLKLLEGKKAEAQALLDKFPSESLSAFWKPRFEKLRAKTQN